MKRTYIADSLVDAKMVADWLEGNGIPCELFNQNAMGALGELPVTPPEVWVRRDNDYDRAKILIQSIEECDTDTEHPCPHCQALCPIGFDICWQCQGPQHPNYI